MRKSPWNLGSENDCGWIRTTNLLITSPGYRLRLLNRWKILAIYELCLLMYAVAGPNPDPNRRGGGQLPNPNECNSTLTSGTSGGGAPTYTWVGGQTT